MGANCCQFRKASAAGKPSTDISTKKVFRDSILSPGLQRISRFSAGRSKTNAPLKGRHSSKPSSPLIKSSKRDSSGSPNMTKDAIKALNKRIESQSPSTGEIRSSHTAPEIDPEDLDPINLTFTLKTLDESLLNDLQDHINSDECVQAVTDVELEEDAAKMALVITTDSVLVFSDDFKTFKLDMPLHALVILCLTEDESSLGVVYKKEPRPSGTSYTSLVFSCEDMEGLLKAIVSSQSMVSPDIIPVITLQRLIDVKMFAMNFTDSSLAVYSTTEMKSLARLFATHGTLGETKLFQINCVANVGGSNIKAYQLITNKSLYTVTQEYELLDRKLLKTLSNMQCWGSELSYVHNNITQRIHLINSDREMVTTIQMLKDKNLVT